MRPEFFGDEPMEYVEIIESKNDKESNDKLKKTNVDKVKSKLKKR